MRRTVADDPPAVRRRKSGQCKTPAGAIWSQWLVTAAHNSIRTGDGGTIARERRSSANEAADAIGK
jgi:hypothetical protein